MPTYVMSVHGWERVIPPPPDVKSARRVVDLLDLLSRSAEPLRLRDISAGLDMPSSSTSALLKTLASTGIIARDQHGGYRLGLRLLTFANSVLRSFDIREIARPVMTEAAIRTRSTCNLAILDGDDVVYLEKVQDPHSLIQLVTHVGARLPAHATALGKVLVAEFAPDAQNAWLHTHDFRRMTKNTATSAEEFLSGVDAYRRAGYAVDDEESHPGVMCFAAPVADHTGHVVAALSLSGIKGAALGFDAADDQAGTETRRVADELSTRLGNGTPPPH